MSEQVQFLLDPKAIMALILKDKGIHEGLWAFTVEFQLSIGVAGPTQDKALPTAMATVARMGIQKGVELNSITYDAAELNPIVKTKRTRKPLEE